MNRISDMRKKIHSLHSTATAKSWVWLCMFFCASLLNASVWLNGISLVHFPHEGFSVPFHVQFKRRKIEADTKTISMQSSNFPTLFDKFKHFSSFVRRTLLAAFSLVLVPSAGCGRMQWQMAKAREKVIKKKCVFTCRCINLVELCAHISKCSIERMENGFTFT